MTIAPTFQLVIGFCHKFLKNNPTLESNIGHITDIQFFMAVTFDRGNLFELGTGFTSEAAFISREFVDFD